MKRADIIGTVVRRSQRGLSLVTTLLFMVAALMLGVSVLSVNVMQERVIGNTKDRDLAFQAAEAALRDAERDIAVNIFPETSFTASCTFGLCTPPSQRATPLSVPVHDPSTGFAWSDNEVRRYGQYTGTGSFPGLPAGAQPRYVIERVGSLGTPPGESAAIGVAPSAAGIGYRITARAVGARPETVVILQSMYSTR